MSKHFATPLQIAAAVMVAIVLVPATGRAQNAQPAPNPTADNRADDLEHYGELLLQVPSQRGRGAGMLEHAGFQRPAGDSRAVSDLIMAASAYYFSGKKERAQALFVRTGDRALSFGDVKGSAEAYLRAAWIASELHDRDGVIDLVGRAQRLANSPLLTETERRGILSRIEDPQAVAMSKH